MYFKQRNNVIDLVNHESLMAQLREDLLLQNEQAILFHQTRYEQKKMREQKLDDQVSNFLIFIIDIRVY